MNRAIIPEPQKLAVRMSGVSATLLGDFWNHFNSTEILLDRLDDLKPDVVCIAGFHPWSHLLYLRKQAHKEWTEPHTERAEDADLFIRAKFTKFFKTDFHTQGYFYHDAYGAFYLADPQQRCCFPDVYITQSNLSACYWACEDQRAKLIAASAHPLVIQEHLASIYTVDQLRDMYLKTLEEVKKRSQALGAEVPDSTSELYERVTGIGKELYGKELLTHRLIYTAAVLHKACQAFKNPVLVQSNQTVGLTYETCKSPMLPVYSELYQPLTYSESLESLLEKLAILTYLDDDSFSRYTATGVCPIDLLYQGQFAHCSKSQVTAAFNHFLAKYKELFNKVYEAELERIPTVYTSGREFTKLADSLAAIEGRNPMLLSHVLHKEIEGEAVSRVLFAQIDANIKAKIAAGISQTSEILALQQAGRGDLSSITVEVMRRLIFEANEQLQVTNLPKNYEQYKKHMKWGISAVDLRQMMDKDFKITAFLASQVQEKPLKISPIGYFFDEENPPKVASVQEQKYFNLALGKGEIPFDVQDKSVEELKAMGGEVVGEIDGEVSEKGLRVNNARQKKKEMGELMEKSGLFGPRE